MATFVGARVGGATCTQNGTGASFRDIMPPEWFRENPIASVVSPPSLSPSSPRTIQWHNGVDREPTEVWGMGTLVFELATGMSAGDALEHYQSARYDVRVAAVDILESHRPPQLCYPRAI